MDNKTLQHVKDALALAIQQKKVSEELLKNLGPAIIETLQPILQEISQNSRISREEILDALSKLKIDVPKADVPQAEVKVTIPDIKVPTPQVTVNTPDVVIPEIKLPTINVPKPQVTVNVPPVKFPDLPKFPEEMEVSGWIGVMGYDKGLLNNPLPVQLRDANGKPVDLTANLTQVLGGGGKADYFTIKGFSQSAYSDLTNADGRLRVSVETGGSGLTDNELRATAVPVSQLSGANWSVAVIDIFGSASASSVFNADNRIKVSVETGGSGLTDSELRASSVPIEQVSGSTWSTYVTGALNSLLAGYENPDNRIKVELPTGSSGLTDTELRATAVPVSQVSGANWSVSVTNTVTVDGSSVTQPVSATDLDIRDLVNASDSVRVYQLSGASWSVEATQGTSPWVVSATDLDIRDLNVSQDEVLVHQVSGSTWSVSVNDVFRTTVASSLINSDDRLRVSLETGSSGLTDSELRATAVPVSQVSGANWSVAVIDIFGSTSASSVFNADNRIKVSVETGGSGLTDSELRASSVPVEQVSGSIWSTYVTGVTNSIAASIIDSSGVQYSGSNPVPISGSVSLSGALTSAVVVGPTVADAADDGNAPVQTGGIARTANPTAVAANDVVKSTHDDLGRQVIRTLQVRDLILTARATLTNGTETTLLAAVAGSYLDCIAVMCANNSDAAVSVDVRAVTAGNIVQTIQVPAYSTAGWAPPVPWPQDETGNNWTIDMSDITGTTVSVSALFTKEI